MARNDSLGDRMKDYESVTKSKLLYRSPKIIRIDGKAFHTLLKNANKPFDADVAYAMAIAAREVLVAIGGTARFAYIQSDECSIVLNDALTLETSAWFHNNVQKIASVSASIFTAHFNANWDGMSLAYFDARVSTLPDLNEVTNYFIWRQQDIIRNSVRSLGRVHFSEKNMDGRNTMEVKAMLSEKGIKWDECDPCFKYGYIVDKKDFDPSAKWHLTPAPLFVQNRQFILDRYNPEEPLVA